MSPKLVLRRAAKLHQQKSGKAAGKLRLLVLFVLAGLGVALVALGQAPTAFADGDVTVHVKQSTLTADCGQSSITGAHFVLNQIDNPPSSITVMTSDGQSTVVPLTFQSGSAAHYVMTLTDGITVVDATALVPSGWTGEFVLSHYECDNVSSSSTPPESSTAASSTAASTTTESSTAASTTEASTAAASTTAESSTAASTTAASTTAASTTAASSTVPESSEVASTTAAVSGEHLENAPSASNLPTAAVVAATPASRPAVVLAETIQAPTSGGFPAGATGITRNSPAGNPVWPVLLVAFVAVTACASISRRQMRRHGSSAR